MKNRRSCRSQEGAILFVSLVILLIVTMLAASSLSTTFMQQRMAVNTEAEMLAFTASESAVNAAAENTSILLQSIGKSGATNPQLTVDLGDDRVVSTATIVHKDIGIATGFSLGVEGGTFGAYRFEIQGSGVIASLNIQSNTTQGLYKIAPSG